MPEKEKPPRAVAATRGADGLLRCPWAGADPLYVAYHDEEWGVPEYDDRAMFEKLVLDGFQAGLSWITILRKRPAFRKAFDGFDPRKIARWSEKKKDARCRTPASSATGRRSRRRWRSRASPSTLPTKAASPVIFGASSTDARSRTPAAAWRRCRPRGEVSQAIAKDLRGSRRQFRRADDRLCLHAGDRHGQRPSRRLLPS